jgi:hypothetical protein
LVVCSSSSICRAIAASARSSRDWPKRESRLAFQRGKLLGDHALLAHGLQPARRRRLVLGAHFVHHAIDLADRLGHDLGAAGALHLVDLCPRCSPK